MTVFEALEQLWNNSAVEIEESSDSSEISEEEEEEASFFMDPVHDQEQAGPSETQRTQPPTTSLEPLSCSLRFCQSLPVAIDISICWMCARAAETVQLSVSRYRRCSLQKQI
ncbi:hypothetical protein AMECASPLE_014527 [Ameca splendens]|uniref:Uncharacterized protein n=1 Tax=Ameca splendens TaxID=208324 RepID=A0ABV0ZY01_9TELE